MLLVQTMHSIERLCIFKR